MLVNDSFFSNKIVNDLNSLPDYAVNSSTVYCSLLDSHLINSSCIALMTALILCVGTGDPFTGIKL